jgi:cell division protein FtsB
MAGSEQHGLTEDERRALRAELEKMSATVEHLTRALKNLERES